MKKLFLSLIVCLPLLSNAQQLPQYSGFNTNPLLFNPAITGYKPYMDVRLHHRTQWSGFEGAPGTSLLSLHSSIDKVKFGVGLVAFNDHTGILNTNGATLSYGHHFPLNEQGTKLAFGANITYAQYSLGQDVVTVHADDALLANAMSASANSFEAGFGTLIYNERWYIGASALNLLNNDVALFTGSGLPNVNHFYVMGGRDFVAGEKSVIQTNFLVNVVPENPTQVDLRVGYEYDQLINVSLGYRTGDALVVGAGVWVLPNLGLQYNYDILTTNLSTAAGGSHEIQLAFLYFYNPIYKKTRKRYNLNLSKPKN